VLAIELTRRCPHGFGWNVFGTTCKPKVGPRDGFHTTPPLLSSSFQNDSVSANFVVTKKSDVLICKVSNN